MSALAALFLFGFGMLGVGLIWNEQAQGVNDDDDE